jgi:hypothetical protein
MIALGPRATAVATMLTVLTIDSKFGGPGSNRLTSSMVSALNEVAAVQNPSARYRSALVSGFSVKASTSNGCAIQLLARADVAIARCGRKRSNLARAPVASRQTAMKSSGTGTMV